MKVTHVTHTNLLLCLETLHSTVTQLKRSCSCPLSIIPFQNLHIEITTMTMFLEIIAEEAQGTRLENVKFEENDNSSDPNLYNDPVQTKLRSMTAKVLNLVDRVNNKNLSNNLPDGMMNDGEIQVPSIEITQPTYTNLVSCLKTFHSTTMELKQHCPCENTDIPFQNIIMGVATMLYFLKTVAEEAEAEKGTLTCSLENESDSQRSVIQRDPFQLERDNKHKHAVKRHNELSSPRPFSRKLDTSRESLDTASTCNTYIASTIASIPTTIFSKKSIASAVASEISDIAEDNIASTSISEIRKVETWSKHSDTALTLGSGKIPRKVETRSKHSDTALTLGSGKIPESFSSLDQRKVMLELKLNHVNEYADTLRKQLRSAIANANRYQDDKRQLSEISLYEKLEILSKSLNETNVNNSNKSAYCDYKCESVSKRSDGVRKQPRVARQNNWRCNHGACICDRGACSIWSPDPDYRNRNSDLSFKSDHSQLKSSISQKLETLNKSCDDAFLSRSNSDEATKQFRFKDTDKSTTNSHYVDWQSFSQDPCSEKVRQQSETSLSQKLNILNKSLGEACLVDKKTNSQISFSDKLELLDDTLGDVIKLHGRDDVAGRAPSWETFKQNLTRDIMQRNLTSSQKEILTDILPEIESDMQLTVNHKDGNTDIDSLLKNFRNSVYDDVAHEQFKPVNRNDSQLSFSTKLDTLNCSLAEVLDCMDDRSRLNNDNCPASSSVVFEADPLQAKMDGILQNLSNDFQKQLRSNENDYTSSAKDGDSYNYEQRERELSFPKTLETVNMSISSKSTSEISISNKLNDLDKTLNEILR